MEKYVIVGGVAGGATTAARLRRLDEHAEIIMFEKGEYVSFANCGLPYYVGGTIRERENLFVMTPEKLKQRLDLDVRIFSEVVSIDREKKEVLIREVQTGREYSESYDKLILSPGAEPLRPPIAGINSKRIFTLRSVPDIDGIKGFIDVTRPRRAVVIGAGFIGLEMAENLHHLGIRVTIVEMAEQVMAPLDFEMAAEVHQHLKTKNVEFYLKDGVSSFVDTDDEVVIKLNSGREIGADIVILSIGVRPESHLAKDAQLELTDRGAIVVNKYLQTSDPDIYALGDAIAFPNPITGTVMNTLLAGPANRQGRIVADNIINNNIREYKGAINTSIAKVFDITVASTGMASKFLRRENISYLSNIIHAGNHAGYYPGAIPMSLKIIFSPEDGRLFGAQAVGYEGVDKRIDVIASVIGRKGTIYDLQEVEHAYAPPYSSAKDPVNISGYAAQNMLEGKLRVESWQQIVSEDMSEIFLLDVRTPDEVGLGTIEGSVNIELDVLREHLDEIPKDKKIITFCQVGSRGYFAARILMQSGFDNVYNLSGGYKTYEHTVAPQGNEDIFSKDVVGLDDVIYPRDQTKQVQSFDDADADVCVDACGLQCPGPILKLKKEVDKLAAGQTLVIRTTDPGFQKDVKAWCTMTGNKLLGQSDENLVFSAHIEKMAPSVTPERGVAAGRDKTLVVFSDDFDRALASFVIANGAVSSGAKVTMFFTFWGLSLLKKKSHVKVKKDLMSKMFGMMLPKSSKKTKLSKLNMMGMGSKMMRFVMKNKNIDSLEDMMRTASENGITMIACQMSMDVMGVKKEELFDFVEIGGVATYLAAADTSNLNLFV